jgi:hypothetical protein
VRSLPVGRTGYEHKPGHNNEESLESLIARHRLRDFSFMPFGCSRLRVTQNDMVA